MDGKIVSVNISVNKGTVKKAVDSAMLTERGLANDAHAGHWHRQVSLLAQESIDKFVHEVGRAVDPGEFAENLTVEGVDLGDVAILDRLEIGDAELEVTQIGKECHGDSCAIFREVGRCVMPKAGVFCRVIRGGLVHAGVPVRVRRCPLKVSVITLSDRAFRGEYDDLSGPEVEQQFEEFFRDKPWRLVVERKLLPDDAEKLRLLLNELTDCTDIIITTGGTGIGPKDVTVDVVRPMLSREIPGIMDYIRNKYGASFPNALLSGSVAGVLGEQCLIFTLPGSSKAVREYLSEITRILEHSLFMVRGINTH